MPQSAPKELQDLQEWFSKAVSSTDNERYLANSQHYITRSSRQDTSERLSVYANDFWPRVINALGDDFKILKKYLGDNEFENWIRRYIEKHPSSSFTLYYIGQHLLNFFKRDYTHKDKTLVEDIVAFEWAKCSAFFAQNRLPFKPGPQSSAMETLMSSSLGLHPSVTLLELTHHPSSFLETNVKSHPCFLVVFRKDYSIEEEEVTAPFYAVLCSIKKGGNLDTIINNLTRNEPEEVVEECVHNMQRYFAHMIHSEWIIAR